jgi:hypothetical protein
MRARAMPGEDPNVLETPEAVTPLIVEMLSPSYAKNGTLNLYQRTGSSTS